MTEINSLGKLALHLNQKFISEIDVVDHLIGKAEAYSNFKGEVVILDGVFDLSDLELLVDTLRTHILQQKAQENQ